MVKIVRLIQNWYIFIQKECLPDSYLTVTQLIGYVGLTFLPDKRYKRNLREFVMHWELYKPGGIIVKVCGVSICQQK